MSYEEVINKLMLDMRLLHISKEITLKEIYNIYHNHNHQHKYKGYSIISLQEKYFFGVSLERITTFEKLVAVFKYCNYRIL